MKLSFDSCSNPKLTARSKSAVAETQIQAAVVAATIYSVVEATASLS